MSNLFCKFLISVVVIGRCSDEAVFILFTALLLVLSLRLSIMYFGCRCVIQCAHQVRCSHIFVVSSIGTPVPSVLVKAVLVLFITLLLVMSLRLSIM
jgi:amino acid permease